MKVRFMLLVDDATKEQQDRVTAHLAGLKVAYWHYFSDAWLVIDDTGKHTIVTLRDSLLTVVPGKTTLVVRVDSGSQWSGFGLTEVFKWVSDSWTPD